MKNRDGAIKALFVVLVLVFTIVIINIGKDTERLEAKESFSFGFNRKAKQITIAAVGDIIIHDEQILAAYDKEKKTYEFNDNYQYIKKYLDDADITWGTVEGTYSGEGLGYSGHPIYNSPESMLKALKDTGFDILNVANNHILDKGEDGYFNTIKNIKEQELNFIGIRENRDEKSYKINSINGIKLGYTSYTFKENAENNIVNRDNKTSQDVYELINYFDYNNIDEELLRIKKDIDDMRSEGAEFIIVGMHWGVDYNNEPSEYQIKIAQKLNEFGVDIILGSHPHVIQPIKKIINEQSGKETLVVYSMGNFISNQREETMGNRLTADGVIIKFNIQKEKKEVKLTSYEYIPTWVNKYKDNNNKSIYEILPVKEVLDSEGNGRYSRDVLKNLETSLEATKKILD